MRGGPVREITCLEALENLHPYLDGELTQELEAAVRRHLAACARCFPRFELERVFLRFVEARTRAQAAPVHLKERVFQAIFLRPGDPPGQ